MHLNLYYQIEVRDRGGRLLRRTRRRRAHSYVKQFIQSLASLLSYAAVSSVLDINNASKTLGTTNSGKMQADGTAAEAAKGPVAGTGSTAVSISDYALASLIAHGTGAGQLQYGACTYSAVSVVGATASFTVTRVLTNGSGASITISEVGMHINHATSAGADQTFLAVRDLVSGGLAVPNGGAATLVYTISVTA